MARARVVIGRAGRREARRPRVEAEFGTTSGAALDLLDLLELAWHDTRADVAYPETVLEDLLVIADGDLTALVHGAVLAVTDTRDLRVAADARRAP